MQISKMTAGQKAAAITGAVIGAAAAGTVTVAYLKGKKSLADQFTKSEGAQKVKIKAGEAIKEGFGILKTQFANILPKEAPKAQ